MLNDAWDQVEADFQRFYCLDLRAELAQARADGPTTWRRLYALVFSLPAEAASRQVEPPPKRKRRHMTPDEIRRMMGEFN